MWPFKSKENFGKVKITSEGALQLSAPLEKRDFPITVEERGPRPLPPEALPEHQEIREMLGEDFLGLRAAEKIFGAELTPEELKAIEKIPFSKEDIERVKKLGMMLVLRVPHGKDGEPLTINNIKKLFAGEDRFAPSKDKKKIQIFNNHSYSQENNWYSAEEFANNEMANLGWSLVKKSAIPESIDKEWNQQEEVLKKWARLNSIDQSIVRRRTPVEVVYDTLVYYGANGKSLLINTGDWTDTYALNGQRVQVGVFDGDGLNITADKDANSAYRTNGNNFGLCPAMGYPAALYNPYEPKKN